jgi:hypothetical protein
VDRQGNKQLDGLSQSSDLFHDTVEDPFQSKDINSETTTSSPESHPKEATDVSNAEKASQLSFVPASRFINSTDESAIRDASSMFQSASTLLANSKDTTRTSPSPSPPPEDKDYSSWFETSEEISAPVSFTSAKSLAAGTPASFITASQTLDSTTSVTTMGFSLASDHPGFSSAAKMPETGFMKASSKRVLVPSAVALAKAAQKIKAWQDEGEDELESASSLDKLAENGIIDKDPNPFLSMVESTANPEPAPRSTPETPTPAVAHAGFSRASLSAATYTTATPRDILKSKNKPFKPPSLIHGPTQGSQPNSQVSGFRSLLKPQHPAASGTYIVVTAPSSSVSAPLATPRKEDVRAVEKHFVTPIRPSLGTIPRSMGTPRRFVTPFKPGMGPKPALSGTPIASIGHTSSSVQSPIKPGVRYPPSTPSASLRKPDRLQVFNLSGRLSSFEQ